MIARLERNYEQRVLTLIVAPARYGKSTLVSMWLDVSETLGSWVSLDAEDDDLRTFLTYVVAAILSVFPDVSLRVQSMLEAPAYPPPLTIARTLLNDLEQLPRRIVIIQILHCKKPREKSEKLVDYPPGGAPYWMRKELES